MDSFNYNFIEIENKFNLKLDSNKTQNSYKILKFISYQKLIQSFLS
jgi:hypothetical protein